MTLMGKISSWIEPKLDPFLDQNLYSVFCDHPLIVYDGGAAGSIFSPFGELTDSEMVKFYGFEPVSLNFNKLAEKYSDNPQVEVRQVALAAEDAPLTFFLRPDKPTVSSSLEDSRPDQKMEATKIDGVRLDSLPERFGFDSADFIKLDTEGTELEILRSGPKMLKENVLGLFLEIGFWRNSDGAVPFHEVDKFLTEQGFVLFDLQINRAHFSGVGGKKDKPRGGDVLYLRNFAEFMEHNGELLSDDKKRIKLLKLVSLSIAWKYLDYALELVDFGKKQGLISDDEFGLIAGRCASVRDISSWVPKFPGRSTLARIFDFLSYALHDHARKGIPAAFNAIGNAWPLTVNGRQPKEVQIRYPVLGRGKIGEIRINLTGLSKRPNN
jgi:FkbM family methyltransferase